MIKVLRFDLWMNILVAYYNDPSINMLKLSNTIENNDRSTAAYCHVHDVSKLLESKGLIKIVKVGRSNSVALTSKGKLKAELIIELKKGLNEVDKNVRRL